MPEFIEGDELKKLRAERDGGEALQKSVKKALSEPQNVFARPPLSLTKATATLGAVEQAKASEAEDTLEEAIDALLAVPPYKDSQVMRALASEFRDGVAMFLAEGDPKKAVSGGRLEKRGRSGLIEAVSVAERAFAGLDGISTGDSFHVAFVTGALSGLRKSLRR